MNLEKEFRYWFEKICVPEVLEEVKQCQILWQGKPLSWEAAHEILAFHLFTQGEFSISQLLELSNNRYELLDQLWVGDQASKEGLDEFYIQTARVLPWGHGVFKADHEVDDRRKNFLRRVTLLKFLQEHGVTSVLDYGAGGGHLSLLAKGMGFERVVHHEFNVFHPFIRWRARKIPATANREFLFTDAQQPLHLDEPVQAVVCTDVAEHVHDPHVLLDQIWGALTPGGYLIWVAVFEKSISSHLHAELRGMEEDLLSQHGFERAGDLPVEYYGHSGLYRRVERPGYTPARSGSLQVLTAPVETESMPLTSELPASAAPLKIGLILDQAFHAEHRWVSTLTPKLVDYLLAHHQIAWISNQKDYEQHLGDVDALISMEPGWAAPRLDFIRTPALRQQLAQTPAFIFYSDPHDNQWREEYFLHNQLDYVLGFYYHPTLYHFKRLPREKLVYFPWSIPDEWINTGELAYGGQTGLTCFGASQHEAYEVRNWCRTFPFVTGTYNSGVENKVMSDAGYFEWLATQDASVAAGSDHPKYRLTMPKYFEIAAAGALLFAQQTDDLPLLGFRDMENCVVFTRQDFAARAQTYMENPAAYLPVRRAGRDLILARHALSKRMAFLEELIRTTQAKKRASAAPVTVSAPAAPPVRPATQNLPNAAYLKPVKLGTAQAQQIVRLGDLHYWLNPQRYLDQELISGRLFEAETVDWLARLVRPGMTVLDVGANFGYYTLLFSRWVKASGKVIAFEPTSEYRQRLEQHLALNNAENVVVAPVGLSDQAGEVQIAVGECSATLHWAFDQTPRATETIQLTRLDDWWQAYLAADNPDKLDVIKVDLDGHEPHFLHGAHATLRRHRPLMVAEFFAPQYEHGGFTASQVIEWLQAEFGYRFMDLRQGHLYSPAELCAAVENRTESVNVLCLPPGFVFDAERTASRPEIRLDLELNQWRSPEDLEVLQFMRLKALLIHAYENVPYYRRLFQQVGFAPHQLRNLAELQALPVLTKTDIQRNLKDLVARNFGAHQLRQDATGGSTGRPLIFYRDHQADLWIDEAARRFRRWVGYLPEDKLGLIWGADRDVPSEFPPNQRWLNSFRLAPEKIDAFIQELQAWQPRALRGYASSLYFVAAYIQQKFGQLPAPLAGALESSAEKLWDWQRPVIEQAFGAKVFDAYGSREIPALGCECDQHAGLHVYSDLRYIEVLKDGKPALPGEAGSLVITDLLNYGMPLIRYEIGDVGEFLAEACPCGRGFPLLKDIKGRVTSTITAPNGAYIHGEYFTHLFYNQPGVAAFQVRQRALDRIEVAIQPAAGFDPALMPELLGRMQAHVGPEVHLTWQTVAEIPPAPSGKYHFTISDVPVQLTQPAAAPVEPPPGKPRLLLIADVPNWIFDRHAQTLKKLLAADFAIEIAYQYQPYDEQAYDLIYPLEWNLVTPNQMRRREKYVTGIRSHISWQAHPFDKFVNHLKAHFGRVHVVSQRLLRLFEPHLPGVVALSHGLDLDFFTPSTTADLSGTRLRLGWAGNRKSPAKGFEQFVEPLGQIEGVELVFCGYSDRNLTQAEMVEFYNSIDVYICASDSEGNNNSLLEAAAMQRAIVTTDVGTVPEYLEHNVSALIVPRDAAAFREAVLRLRDNPGQRKQMGLAARQALLGRGWGWQAKAAEYRAFFWDALQAAGYPAVDEASAAHLSAAAAEFVNQANACFEQGDTAAALHALEQALTHAPQSAELHRTYGNLLLQQGEIQAARQQFSQAISLAESYAPAHLDLAVAHYLSEDLPAALAAVETCLRLDETNLDAWKFLGRLRLASSAFDDGIAAYMNVLRSAPDDLECLVVLGSYFARVDDHPTARKLLQRALVIDPDNQTAQAVLQQLASSQTA